MRLQSILIGAGTALAVLGAAIAVAVSRIDPADYLPAATAKVKELTGRDLNVDGKIGFSFSLVPTVSVENVRLQNVPWGSRPDMIRAKRIEVEIALLPLLGGKLDIRGLTLVEPDVILEVNAKNENNWTFEPSGSRPKADDDGKSEQGIDIRRAHLEKGVVLYRTDKDRAGRKLDIAALDMKGSGRHLDIDLDARLNDEALEVHAKVDRDAAPMTAEVTAKSPGMTLATKLTLPASRRKDTGFSGAFDARVHDWNSVARLAGMDPIRLPGMKATGMLKSDGDAVSIEDLKATLGRSDFAGTLRSGKDKSGHGIEVNLSSSLVDVAELQGSKKDEKPKDGRIFSAEAFPLEALKDLTGRFDARIARLALKDGKAVDGVEVKAVADRGRINADPVRLQIEGRELRIRASLDASTGKSLGMDVGIDGTGISLGALGALLNLSGTPEGSPTDVSIRFASRGASMRSLMAEATADVRIVVGPGRLRNRAVNWGADVTELLNALNPARASDPYTDLKCAVVRLPIRQGVARIENSIAAETAKVNVIAAGVIDLRSEALDLGFRPKAATGLGIGLGGLASLGRLRGTLADPKVQLDMGGAAKAATQLGLAAATGGLSLLASGLLPDDVPERPCQAALTGPARGARDRPAQKPEESGGFLGGIKKLFGR